MKIYVLLILFLCGCAGGKDISGVYWSDKSPDKLTINKDYTFSYAYRFQFQYKHATGNWSKDGRNKYILNSFIKSKRLPVNVSESEANSDSNFLSIHIQIPDQTYYICEIFINDRLYEKRRCDSLSMVAFATPINSVFFGITADERIPGRSLDTLYTQVFHPKMASANSMKVNVEFTDSLFNYRIFNNTMIKIANNNLMFYDDDYSSPTLLRKNRPARQGSK
jgi:hypothetical protein